MIRAAPRPSRNDQPMISTVRFGASAVVRDPAAYTTQPIANALRRPMMLPIFPPVIIMVAITSVYSVIAVCTPVTVVSRSLATWAMETFMTELSRVIRNCPDASVNRTRPAAPVAAAALLSLVTSPQWAGFRYPTSPRRGEHRPRGGLRRVPDGGPQPWDGTLRRAGGPPNRLRPGRPPGRPQGVRSRPAHRMGGTPTGSGRGAPGGGDLGPVRDPGHPPVGTSQEPTERNAAFTRIASSRARNGLVT